MNTTQIDIVVSDKDQQEQAFEMLTLMELDMVGGGHATVNTI